jgi:hypothetical protein
LVGACLRRRFSNHFADLLLSWPFPVFYEYPPFGRARGNPRIFAQREFSSSEGVVMERFRVSWPNILIRFIRRQPFAF